MAAYSYTDNTIAELVAAIGLSEPELKRVLKKDRAYINRLVILGYTQEEAERYSFIGDLQNILSLMRSHQFSAKMAARLLGQTPDSPYEFSSTEEDEEDEDEEEEPTNEESDDTSTYPSSPSTSHLRSSCSVTSSSEDDTVAERKRIKLDPDYVPSEDTTPAITAPSSQVSSDSEREEEEEEEEEEETDAESYIPSSSTTEGGTEAESSDEDL
jgi:hypothetical protein